MGLADLTKLWAAGRRRRDLYRDGMAAFNRGDHAAAVASLGPIAEGDNLHARLARFFLGHAHRGLGLAALEGGRLPEAIGQLQLACRYNPAGGELARCLAVAFARADQHEQAAAPLERALAAAPADARARIMLAQAQWRTGQPHRAEITLHEGLTACRDEPATARSAVQFHLALLVSADGRWPQAEELLASCVALDQSNGAAWRYLGLACGAQGRAEEALEHLRQAQRLLPADPHVALELALASAAANKAVAPVKISLKMASQAAAAGSVEAADDLDRLARAIVAEPEFIQAFLDLEPAATDSQIFGVLSLSLARAIEHRPRYADLHYYFCRVHRRLGRTADALDSAEQAIAINPRYVAALIQSAELYRQTAQRTTACERLRAAISAGADYPDVHLLMGELHREMGRVEQARRSFERALRLNPNYERARKALDALAA